jgi:hypothetical protein
MFSGQTMSDNAQTLGSKFQRSKAHSRARPTGLLPSREATGQAAIYAEYSTLREEAVTGSTGGGDERRADKNSSANQERGYKRRGKQRRNAKKAARIRQEGLQFSQIVSNFALI